MSKLKTRHLLKKKKWQKGPGPIWTYLKKLQVNSQVVVKPCKDYKRNIPSRRIVGHIAKILQNYKNKNYKIKIEKKVYVLPRCHLKAL